MRASYILARNLSGDQTEAVIAVLDFLLNKVGFKEIKATYVSLILFQESHGMCECSM